jgi:hypothetical protein
MFDLPTSVTVSGCEYPIRTDFRVILEIFVMLDDPDLTDADKTAALLRMFYVRREASPEGNRPPDAEAALRAFTDFVDPRHGNQGKKSSGRLIDWSQDFDLMVAPINHILGFECRSADYLHWHTFLSAYLEIPPDSVFARVLRIREKLRTGRKLEKYEKQWYRKNADLVHLKPKFSKAEEELIKAWT